MSNIKIPLANLFYTTNPQKILFYFLNHPKEQIYDREVSRLTGISRAGTNLALRALAEAEILTQEKKGRMVFYSLDGRDSLIRQLKILQNMILLTPLLHCIQNQTIRVNLFGSAARGENSEESDLDLFILTREKKEIEEKVHKYIAPLNLQPIIHTPQEWAKIEKENKVFANQVLEGIVLHRAYEP